METKVYHFTVHPVRIEDGIFTVEATSVDGDLFYHGGTKDFPYFTEAQAQALVQKVRRSGQINDQYWVKDAGGYYGTEDHEASLIEKEYFAA